MKTDEEILHPKISWYAIAFWLPVWLFLEFFKGIYVHLIQPDPPHWKEKKAAEDAKFEEMDREVRERIVNS